MAVGVRLGFKKFVLPKFCTNGDWGLCQCTRFEKASSVFDFEHMKETVKWMYGIDLMEEPVGIADYEIEEGFHLWNYTGYNLPVHQGAAILHEIIQKEKPERMLSTEYVNMGFSYGKWLVETEAEQKMYLTLYNMFKPTASIRKIVSDTKYKLTRMPKAERLVVVHIQLARTDEYAGCQRTTFIPMTKLILEKLKIPTGSAVLLVGAGFEQKALEDFELSELADKGIYVHIQPELLSISRANQFPNSQITLFLAFEADYFISTTCESQFGSHIMRVRQMKGLSTCSTADVSQTAIPHIYPQEYMNHPTKVPYLFPTPIIGNVFGVDRCSDTFFSTVESVKRDLEFINH